MCSMLRSLLSKIAKILKKVWDFLRPLLAVVAIVFAIFYPVIIPWLQTAFPAFWAAVGSFLPSTGIWASTTLEAILWRGAVGLGIGFLFDSETAGSVVSSVADAVGKVAESAATIGGAVVGGVVGGTVGAILDNPWALAALGVGIWYFFFRDGSKDEEKRQNAHQARMDELEYQKSLRDLRGYSAV